MNVTQGRVASVPGPPSALPLAAPDHLASLAAEAAAFSQALAGEPWELRVPMSADWTLRDLTRHLGGIHRWGAAVVASGREEPRPEEAVDDDALGGWFAEGADLLVAALAQADPQSPCWTFGPEQTVAFWFRRQANETAVHRVDAQDAIGAAGSIAPLRAADAVDELFSVSVPRAASRWDASPRLPAPVLLSATDTGHAWLLVDDPARRLPAARLVTGVVPEAAAVLSGTASDLLLALWRRRPPSILGHEGDAAVSDLLFSGRLTN
ncbi:maleylpyruvate isomerase family mycothiol-dependent enzyme [Propionicicella superfundia]|uniref:maleylpyruvate isomerase family mycothiol-dependent enzyme n=1 Tax=Propionicicella superfundia TaxID=348582 RepID=UPI000400660C|nr:maleylpyruvate isomerase family mycothiol-dependent enzyme [Propionicicella superfundia]